MLLAAGEVADDDPRQAALALQPDQEILVGGDVEDQPAEPVRDEVAPVRAVGRRDRRGDDPEILGVAAIGEDVEEVAGMVERVLLRRPRSRRTSRGVPVGSSASRMRTSEVS